MEREIGHQSNTWFNVIEPDGKFGPKGKSAEEALEAWRKANPAKSLDGCRVQKMTLDMRISITNQKPF